MKKKKYNGLSVEELLINIYLSIKAIDKAMQWSRALSPTQTQELIIKNISYSKQKWNIQQFEYEFHNLLKSEIINHTK